MLVARAFRPAHVALRPQSKAVMISGNPVCTTKPRLFSFSARHLQNIYEEAPPSSFYKTHGRAFAKCFTLAFLTYQFSYYCWLTLETEYMRDEKESEIKSLEGEVRLLEEGRKSHRANER